MQSNRHYLKKFAEGSTDEAGVNYIPTGFDRLDATLSGGLREGLYFIGAASSMGKTTFVLQIADQIAQSGRDVLYFSLEMSRDELIAKSISRNTFKFAMGKNGTTHLAKSTTEVFDILSGSNSECQDIAIKNHIDVSVSAYKQYANHIYICEDRDGVNVERIRKEVKRHSLFSNKHPVVIVDYLQILAPDDNALASRLSLDKMVVDLKKLSRDYKIPVIGVSSFSRSSYSKSVEMESFKETGVIEYSCDVLMGMQFCDVGQKGYSEIEAKRKNPREIEIVIIKNRNGRVGERISFRYRPKYNYFEEAPVQTDKASAQTQSAKSLSQSAKIPAQTLAEEDVDLPF